MKTLIWSLTALLAALWTGFIAAVHQLTGWLLSAIDTGSLQGAAGTVGGLALPPVPAWLEPWIDTASIAALQSFVVSLVEWLGAVMPSGDALMAWVGPLLWVGWGLVLVPMQGHTPGSVGLFLTLDDGRRFFFTGDTSWRLEGFTGPREKYWLSKRMVDNDPEGTRGQLEKVHRLLQEQPQLRVIPAHDEAVQRQLGYYPKWVE